MLRQTFLVFKKLFSRLSYQTIRSTPVISHGYDDKGLPASVDWRKKGAVTPVKDQLGYASCWAFATVGAVESAYQIRTGCLLNLSAQELLDCNRPPSRMFDGGGTMYHALVYITRNGIHTEEDYPYRACSGNCMTNKLKGRKVVKISRFRRLPLTNGCIDEMELQWAVAKQPICCYLSATYLEHYRDGLFYCPWSSPLNHMVLIVGYDTSEDGYDYWIVKNSWGTSWGIDGYTHIIRNSGIPQGVCGMNSEAYYPVI